MSTHAGRRPPATPNGKEQLAPVRRPSEAYDVAPDRRFLFHFQRSMRAGEEAPRQEIIVVQNWFEELKARVPTAVAK
jgi:hypothetical protein